jgi:hypothetical protein
MRLGQFVAAYEEEFAVDMNVDPVQEWPRNLGDIALNLRR